MKLHETLCEQQEDGSNGGIMRLKTPFLDPDANKRLEKQHHTCIGAVTFSSTNPLPNIKLLIKIANRQEVFALHLAHSHLLYVSPLLLASLTCHTPVSKRPPSASLYASTAPKSLPSGTRRDRRIPGRERSTIPVSPQSPCE